MKCDICGTETNSATVVFLVGYACSEDCAQIAQGRRKARHDELAAEPLALMPDALTTHDFERWALKLAVHIIRGLPEDKRHEIEDANPIMLTPEVLSLDLKDQILRYVPRAYYSEAKTPRGIADAEFMFRQPVPRAVITLAAQKAGIIQ